MFDKKYEERLIFWAKFRDEIEVSDQPYKLVQDLYNSCPISSLYTDPWDNTVWPDPWQLLEENRYCEFCIVLAQCYSLQLTERFSTSKLEIHIYVDQDKSDMRYLLIIDDKDVLGYDRYEVVSKDSLPKTLQPQMSYLMPTLQ